MITRFYRIICAKSSLQKKNIRCVFCHISAGAHSRSEISVKITNRPKYAVCYFLYTKNAPRRQPRLGCIVLFVHL